MKWIEQLADDSDFIACRIDADQGRLLTLRAGWSDGYDGGEGEITVVSFAADGSDDRVIFIMTFSSEWEDTYADYLSRVKHAELAELTTLSADYDAWWEAVS